MPNRWAPLLTVQVRGQNRTLSPINITSVSLISKVQTTILHTSQQSPYPELGPDLYLYLGLPKFDPTDNLYVETKSNKRGLRENFGCFF